MDQIVFDSPTGSVVYSPTLDEILELLRTKGEAYWNSLADTGFAALHYRRNDEKVASLVFSKKDEYGFHTLFVEYPERQEQRKEFFAVGGEDYEDVTILHLSGNALRLPRALFIDENQAADVVRQFFQRGTKSNHSFWIPLHALKWNLGQGRRIETPVPTENSGAG